ncbi:MAG: class I SAM-dependent methyltransferase [Solirubrobacterales bacterium]|nr:class I SAM-dependent methyltransferase [Solirubrobacterales bacterium]
MAATALPLPPTSLLTRVGTVEGADPVEFYLGEGARLRGVTEEMLPADWHWDGKRVLDFGCGAARVLRQFATEAERGVFWGCDIDTESIVWDQANLTPPFHFFQNAITPPLSLSSQSLDVIIAMSVFTHIGELWSDWLLELHRLLDDGGILIASFLGAGIWEGLVLEEYREDEIGMSVLHGWEGPDAWVFHSEWWLREHWGRGFDVIGVKPPPRAPDGSAQVTHSYIALRTRPVQLSKAELERIVPGDAREVAGLQTSLRLAQRESSELAARLPSPSRRELVRRRLAAIKRLPRRGGSLSTASLTRRLRARVRRPRRTRT